MILIINCGSSKTPKFQEALESFGVKNRIVSLQDLPKEDYSEVDGIIISGAPILLTEVDNTPYIDKFQFLKIFDRPVLGVCFGHQMVGLLHGASVERCDEDRDWQSIKFTDQSVLLAGIEKHDFMEDHCEYITLPLEFKLVGSSSVCEVEVMEHKSKPIYGVQFHPEVSGAQGKALLKNFCDLCSK